MIIDLVNRAYSLNNEIKNNSQQCELITLQWLIEDSMCELLSSGSVEPSDAADNIIYYGVIPAQLQVRDFNDITPEMITTYLNEVSKEELPRTAVRFGRAGDLVVVAVSGNKVASKDNGFGGKTQFSSSAQNPETGAPIESNGDVSVEINGTTYTLYGEFMVLQSGTVFIYVD